MVRRFFEVLTGEIRGLHEAAYLLGVFALLSQVLGLLRDRLLAGTFGAGETLDIYYAAFKLPDLIFVGIASVVSIYVLIPFLSERANSTDSERKFLDDVFSVFFAAMVVVSAIAFFLAPALMEYFFPGISAAGRGDDLTLLTRVLLLQPILLGLSNLLGSITQTRRRFLLYAVSPLLYNVGIMAGVVFLYPRLGLVGLSLGVLLGALLHLMAQVPFAVRERLFPRLSLSIAWATIREVVLLSVPRTLALFSHQVALLFVLGMASVLGAGAISIFHLAYNLQAVPLAIVGVSYSLAAFPTLARLFSNGDREQFLEQVITAARHILFWSLPIMALLIVLRAQIVRAVLGAGVFGWEETRLTAAALALFAVSLAAQNLSLLFVRGYYAAGRTRRPLFVNVFTALLVVLFSFGLIIAFEHSLGFRSVVENLLRVSGIPGTAVLMLPLGYSLALIVNALLLWSLFERDFTRFFARLAPTLFQSMGAALMVGVSSYLALNVFDDVFSLSTFWGIVLQGFFSGLVGLAAGVSLLILLRSVELAEAVAALRHKFWRASALAPEKESLE